VARSPRTVTRTITITKAEPRRITTWKTRTVTVTVTASPSGSATVPCCVPPSGGPFPVGDGAYGQDADCSVTWREQYPQSAGTLLVLTAPDGASSMWMVASTGG
jgi:hypothetical protein